VKLVFCLFFAIVVSAQTLQKQDSGTTASLRGVSAVNDSVVWASGTGGTFLRTTDGGANWTVGKLPGAADIDFRAIHAFDASTAILLSIGNGEKSRIYKTTNAGATWDLLYTNPDPKGFFDSLAFWDADHGILLGDPVDGRFVVMTTNDGGATWKKEKTPLAEPQEGAFAASNSCLTVHGQHDAWFGTGGPKGARVFHSTDGGQTWTVAKTPMRNDSASAGIFALAFADARHGVAVGGDYNKPEDQTGNIAITADGGKTWTAAAPPNGFRSDVKYIASKKYWIVTGTSGSDISTDDGKKWRLFDHDAYNAMSCSGSNGWAVGPKGAIARLLLLAPLVARDRAPDLRLGIIGQLFEHR
jgi:photosystem II stability/assembly factor-like uncharacterized protein